jgi:hypothetical protein
MIAPSSLHKRVGLETPYDRSKTEGARTFAAPKAEHEPLDSKQPEAGKCYVTMNATVKAIARAARSRVFEFAL